MRPISSCWQILRQLRKCSFRIGDFLLGKLIDALRSATKKQLRGQRQALSVQTFVSCLIGATVAASAGYVAYQAALGVISVGDFVLFTAALAAAQGSAASLLSQTSMLLASLTRFRSYLEILHLPDEMANGSQSVPPLSRGIRSSTTSGSVTARTAIGCLRA